MMIRTSFVVGAGMIIAFSGVTTAQGASMSAGFDARADKHRSGVFITADELQKRSPARLSDLFRNMSGLTLSTSDGGKLIVTSSRGSRAGVVAGTAGIATAGTMPTPPGQSAQPTVAGSRCLVAVGMDGQIMDASFSVDDVPVTSVHGIEVYTGSAHAPVEFGAGNNSGCGVIMIWTKTGADKP